MTDRLATATNSCFFVVPELHHANRTSETPNGEFARCSRDESDALVETKLDDVLAQLAGAFEELHMQLRRTGTTAEDRRGASSRRDGTKAGDYPPSPPALLLRELAHLSRCPRLRRRGRTKPTCLRRGIRVLEILGASPRGEHRSATQRRFVRSTGCRRTSSVLPVMGPHL